MTMESWYIESKEEFEYCIDCIENINTEEEIIHCINDSDEIEYCCECGKSLVRTMEN